MLTYVQPMTFEVFGESDISAQALSPSQKICEKM